MPLESGSSRAAISANIATEIRAGKDPKQAAAIAYSKARGDSADVIRAAGIIFVCGDKALFLQRSGEGDMSGTWAWPGGKIEAGESAEEAAKRECREEIGKMPKGALVLHSRRISTGVSNDPSLQPVVSEPGVDFTTFVVKVADEFIPELNEEHTAFAWAPITAPPQPMHPGASDALAKFSMNDYDLAVAIANGALTSPQQFMNIWLFDMRITGTGMSFRAKHEEFVMRDPMLYLNDYFLARCNGLPVIVDHPPGDTLDTDEYRERNIGTIVLPYVKGDEVWGIAKIYDAAAAQMMMEETLSTSPAVVFRAGDGNTEIEVDGAKILIEGRPSLLDHLAVCRAGVWDKMKDPSGIVSTRGDSQVTEDEKAKADKAKADAAVADGVKSMMDAFRADMKPFMDSVAECNKRMDSWDDEKKADAKRRSDAAEEEKKKADAAAKADSEKSEDEKKADKAKKDAEDDMMAADKAKKDSEDEEKKKADAAKADAARVDAAVKDAMKPLLEQITELRTRTPALLSDEQRSHYTDAQARADSAYLALGKQAPAPMMHEELGAYRRRLAHGLKDHSVAWKDSDILAMKADDNTFGNIERAIYADAVQAARNPVGLPVGTLRKMVRKDDFGREIIEFAGKPEAWMDSFSGNRRQVRNIQRPARSMH